MATVPAHTERRKNQSAIFARRSGGTVAQLSKSSLVKLVTGGTGVALGAYVVNKKQVHHKYVLKTVIKTDMEPKKLRDMHMKVFNSKLLHNVLMEYFRSFMVGMVNQGFNGDAPMEPLIPYEPLHYDELGHEKTVDLMPGYNPVFSGPITTVVSDDEVNKIYSFSNFTKLPHPLHEGSIVASYERTKQGEILCTIIGEGFGGLLWQFLNNKMMPQLFQPQMNEMGRQLRLKKSPKLEKTSETITDEDLD